MSVPDWYPYQIRVDAAAHEAGKDTMGLDRSGDLEPDFSVSFDAEGLCVVLVRGDFMPDLIRAIAHHIHAEHESGQHMTGILLDLQAVQLVSLIRLSGLLDLLSRYELPIAVVLEMIPQQERLVDLLHQTLPYRDRIAYFDTPDEARPFLEGKRPSN
ncbi:MAG TPA: hypothetical protein PKD09_13515 [Aggregatilinea sp.]|uniref:hypothetical protein n=1 Tax=Aggregatilinea sp. TaxID=2806333 RepID=UPI002B9D5DB0|nr:hypothetical protein [Aggregatilinea sp.]HML22665.1 hypothetical protein [Aggregatilinea sp.]